MALEIEGVVDGGMGLVRRMRSGFNNGKKTVHYAVPS